MSEWKPIETAPKDGEAVLLYKPNERMVGEYILTGYWGEWPEEEECWLPSGGGGPLGYHSKVTGTPQGYPTHWMPLPTPPQDDRHND